jgi:hypothetical protein
MVIVQDSGAFGSFAPDQEGVMEWARGRVHPMIDFEFEFDQEQLAAVRIEGPSDWSGHMYTGFPGAFRIRSDSAEFEDRNVPLIRLSRIVHSSLTTMLLYRRPAGGTDTDEPGHWIEFSADGGYFVITVDHGELGTFRGSFIETLANFGSAYKNLIRDLVAARPDIAKNHLFMMELPDGLLLTRELLYPLPTDDSA